MNKKNALRDLVLRASRQNKGVAHKAKYGITYKTKYGTYTFEDVQQAGIRLDRKVGREKAIELLLSGGMKRSEKDPNKLVYDGKLAAEILIELGALRKKQSSWWEYIPEEGWGG